MTVLYTENTNVGTASALATYAGDANYLGSADATTFEIEQAATTTVLTCPLSVIYSGAAQEPCSAEVTGPGGLNEVVTVLYTDNTNVGTASASATYAGDANYLGSADATTFEIEQAATTTVLTCPLSVIYSGAAQEPCSAEVTGPGGLNEVVTVLYTDNTNVGTASASATYAGDANYLGSADATTFEIEQAATTTVLTCPLSVIYSGAAQEPCSAEVTGPGGLNEVVTVLYTDNTNVGTASASATYAGDANYLGSADATTFEIEQAATTTVLTCPLSVIYSGAAQEPCSAEVTGPGGLNEVVTVLYTDNTNVGTASASATYAGDANYSW